LRKPVCIRFGADEKEKVNEVDGDHGEKREEHLADEPHEGISF
jgi:hypothetical protein